MDNLFRLYGTFLPKYFGGYAETCQILVAKPTAPGKTNEAKNKECSGHCFGVYGYRLKFLAWLHKVFMWGVTGGRSRWWAPVTRVLCTSRVLSQ
jgi:hypothetical protein